MRNILRLLLAMGLRVLNFCETHVLNDPAYLACKTRLGDILTGIRALAEQQVTGQISAGVAVALKQELRRAIYQTTVVIRRIADTAPDQQPEFARRFRIPVHRLNQRRFLVAAQAFLTEATAQRDTLLQLGMSDTLLADLKAQIDEYDHAFASKASGTNVQVGASNDLTRLTRDLMRTVRLLDALYRRSYAKEPEQLASWQSARDIGRPAPQPAPPVEPAA